MAEVRADIATVTGAAAGFGATRLPDGRMYVVHHDASASPAKSYGYISSDDGETWTDESWSQSIGSITAAGGNEPTVMADPAGRVWCAMATFDGGNVPVVIQRDEEREIWGQPGVYFIGYHVFSTKTNVTYLQAEIDIYTVSGVWNIGACFVHGGDLWYVDMIAGAGNEVLVSGVGTITAPRMVFSSGGTKSIAWVADGVLYGSQRAGRTGSFSPRVQISDVGQTVVWCDDIAIQPGNEQPAVLYEVNNGGAIEMWLAELDVLTATWSRIQVSEPGGYQFGPHASLAYDARGSVYVIAYYDVGGAGRYEVCQFDLPRALSPSVTTWTFTPRTASSAGDAQQTRILGNPTPFGRGFRPNVPDQGAFFFFYDWRTGAPPTGQTLTAYNPDSSASPTTGYPTYLSIPSGEEPYPSREDTSALPSVALAGEGSPAYTFPDVQAEYGDFEVSRGFVTNVHTFVTSNQTRISKFPNGRTVVDVVVTDHTSADFGTLWAFVRARKKDKAVFNWTLEETSTTYPMTITTARFRREHEDGVPADGAYALRFQMQEAI